MAKQTAKQTTSKRNPAKKSPLKQAKKGKQNAPTAQKIPLLPAGVSLFLHNAMVRIFGAVLILCFILISISLYSFNINDPSWNLITQGNSQNILGIAGSYGADFLLQSLGLGAIIFSFPFLTWGVRIIFLKTLPHGVRNILIWPFAVTAGVFALSFVPSFEAWILPQGLGGSVGDLIMGNFRNIVASKEIEFHPLVFGVVAFLIWLYLYMYTIGLSVRNWQRIGRAIKWVWVKFFTLLAIIVIFIMAEIVRLFRLISSLFSPRPEELRQDPSFGERFSDKLAQQKKNRINVLIPAEETEDSFKLNPKAIAPSYTSHSEEKGEISKRNFSIFEEKTIKKEVISKREASERQPMFQMSGDKEFILPPLSLLTKPSPVANADKMSHIAMEQNAHMLEAVLADYGVKGEITKVRPGPVVTLYELEPAPGTKSSRVINLAEDIARSMSAISARIAVIPGKNAIGIELPNSKREIVSMREIVASNAFEDHEGLLPMTLGKNIGGDPIVADLAAMPHLLVAGTTGSGKSVALNTMILSFLYRNTPAQCRLIMIDPKMLELSIYDNIPHLLTPVVTDPHKAVVALKWAVREMEQRYQNMSKLQVRNIGAYNDRLKTARDKGEEITSKIQTGFDPETGNPTYEEESIDLTHLPMIVVVVDEMADLMLVAGKDIEALIQRLAQMARAAGIHIIMATQRPSVDVITGTIKANFPTRISFQVTSKIDSRTILGEAGAEQLLGKGDMLFMAGGGRITRVHGPFVSDGEVEAIVKDLKKQGRPDYLKNLTDEPEEGYDAGFLKNSQMGKDEKSSGDELYDKAVAVVARDRKASTSYIQRQLQIGYNRAANIIEKMEREGVVSAANRVGKREILVEDQSEDSF